CREECSSVCPWNCEAGIVLADSRGIGQVPRRRHSGARVQRANPESIAPHEYLEKWLPSSALSGCPGMTKESTISRHGLISPPAAPPLWPYARPPSAPSAGGRDLRHRSPGW